MLKYIPDSPYFDLTLAIITVASMAFAIFVYIKSRKKKELWYEVLATIPIESIGGIELLYKKQIIEKASLTKLIIWNSGDLTVNKDDIAKHNPIYITCEGILNAEKIGVSEKSNDFHTIQKDNETIIVSFDYIDPMDGAKFSILHTGEFKGVSGKVKGGNSLEDISIFKSKRKLIDKISIAVMVAFILFIILTSVSSVIKLAVAFLLLAAYIFIQNHRPYSIAMPVIEEEAE